MSDYIPTTAEIKKVYFDRKDWLEHGYRTQAARLIRRAEINNEFNRWLEQHDAEIAKATEERIFTQIEERNWDYLEIEGSEITSRIKGEQK